MLIVGSESFETQRSFPMTFLLLQPGNPVFFSRYPQGAKAEVQPIAWQTQDMQHLCSKTGCVRRIGSTVDRWLRETFLPAALSREEQAAIHDPQGSPQ